MQGITLAALLLLCQTEGTPAEIGFSHLCPVLQCSTSLLMNRTPMKILGRGIMRNEGEFPLQESTWQGMMGWMRAGWYIRGMHGGSFAKDGGVRARLGVGLFGPRPSRRWEWQVTSLESHTGRRAASSSAQCMSILSRGKGTRREKVAVLLSDDAGTHVPSFHALEVARKCTALRMSPMPHDERVRREQVKALLRDDAGRRVRYFCELCNCGHEKQKNWEQHVVGKQHTANVAASQDTFERFLACSQAWGEVEVKNDTVSVVNISVSSIRTAVTVYEY